MKTDTVIVANLKCNGCAATIKNELLKIEGVQRVDVDVNEDTVSVYHDDVDRKLVIKKLHVLGYPEATEKNGLLLQLKSYTSCMAGKVNNLLKEQT